MIPVADTVKRVRDGIVAETLDREALALAQTPQAFALDALRLAHGRAIEAGVALTDDAAALEMSGARVRAIAGDPMNLKITTLFDLAQAEARMGGIGD